MEGNRMPDRRLATLRVALGFLQLAPRAPELCMLRRWLRTWAGLGLIAVGVERQGYLLSLSHIADGKRRAQFSPLTAVAPGATRRIMASDVSANVEANIAAGLLPTPAKPPTKMWVGKGNGRLCDACDEPITDAEIECETDPADGQVLRFHRSCLEAWHQARASRMAG
jgi:hypothetical protein